MELCKLAIFCQIQRDRTILQGGKKKFEHVTVVKFLAVTSSFSLLMHRSNSPSSSYDHFCIGHQVFFRDHPSYGTGHLPRVVFDRCQSVPKFVSFLHLVPLITRRTTSEKSCKAQQSAKGFNETIFLFLSST
jgi:hypothetical protein